MATGIHIVTSGSTETWMCPACGRGLPCGRTYLPVFPYPIYPYVLPSVPWRFNENPTWVNTACGSHDAC